MKRLNPKTFENNHIKEENNKNNHNNKNIINNKVSFA
jgi:hypothetical protein